MKNVLLIFSLVVSHSLYSQDTSNTTVIVHKDPRIDIMIKREAEINTSIKRSNARTSKGYRLMVINTINRNEAIQAKTKIYTHFPELKSYLIYQSPYFKLKAGNFRNREEAEKYQKDLNIYFSKGVFVISDIIEIKPEKDNE